MDRAERTKALGGDRRAVGTELVGHFSASNRCAIAYLVFRLFADVQFVAICSLFFQLVPALSQSFPI